MLPSIFDLAQHITNFGSKIFNNDLDANHYLYSVSYGVDQNVNFALWFRRIVSKGVICVVCADHVGDSLRDL